MTILLVFSAGIISQAQTPNFKMLIKKVQSVQKQLVPDKRVAIFDVSLNDTTKPVITVSGKTSLPEGKTQILKLLSANGIQFVDSLQVLPQASLGDKTWGLSTLSESSMRSGPDHPAELVSQALMGTPVKVLEKEGSWYRIQTPDQYIGWVDGRGIARKTEAEMTLWKQSRRFIFNQTYGYALAAPKKNAPHISDLVLGDLFEIVSEKNGYLQMIFPDGRTGFVKKADCLSFQEWTNQKPDAQNIISVAKEMLGVPYLWGGASCKAVDCSGMTKTAYYAKGIILARDASQQGRYGEHLDINNLTGLEPGDLLFFGRSVQRITHVGLYMGNNKYINSAGLVRINNINPEDPDFNASDRKDLVAACRVLNSLNTEGITLVKDHPWYSVQK